MSEPFLAEVRIVGFNFAPRGWALCDGQILPINQNQSLYSLLGTTYGGDGRTTFALPDLRGRTPVHPGRASGGPTIRQGQRSGAETHTLSAGEAKHSHPFNVVSTNGTSTIPTGNTLATSPDQPYVSGGTPVAMAAGATTSAGGGQAHDNMQPYLAINFCIALQGLFPSRN